MGKIKVLTIYFLEDRASMMVYQDDTKNRVLHWYAQDP
jgi:hypothetical protein